MPKVEDTQNEANSKEPKEELIREDEEEYEGKGSNKPLQGRPLQQAISQLASSGSEEAQEGLRQLGDFLKQKLSSPQESEDELTPTTGFDGRSVTPSLPSDDFRRFIGTVCAEDRWGGVLTTSKRGLKEAVFNATPEDVVIYNPDDPDQGYAGQSLFSLLRAFDPHLPDSVSFIKSLERFIAARNQLLTNLDLLLNYPIVLFGGYPEARQVLYEYLDAYSELLRIFKEYSGLLHQLDPQATRLVASELLRLDTIYCKYVDDDRLESWKALITPLHPLHLWRFREIFNAVHAGQRLLTEEEQVKLAFVLPDLPHLLHYLILSQNVTSGSVVLPQSGTLETLPTYENHTNRYLGDDGTDFVQDLLLEWLKYAPYSRPQIRLAVVDIPNLHIMLRSVVNFLKTKRQTNVIVHCYYTNDQNYPSELAQLDFEDRDYDIADAMRSKRLVLHFHAKSDVKLITEQLERKPVHILYLFDQSQYQIDFGPRARQLLVSPLVVTYDYTYNKMFRRGTIAPSSDAEEGVFAYYHFVVQQVADLPAGKQIRLQYNPEAELTTINNILHTEATRWLVLADRVLTNYHPENAVPMGEKRSNRREIGVWSKVTDQAIRRFIDLLRRYNLQPDKATIIQLLQKHGHIATEGAISLSIIGGTPTREAEQKGLIGKLLAIKWYVERYPDALIASLDSNRAHTWLQERTDGNERADLIGLRMEGQQLIIEPIEVKTHKGDADIHVRPDPVGGRSRLIGHPVDQLQATINILESIFGKGESQPIFTPARREVLRYQLQRECFHDIHNPEWQAIWHERLSQAFAQPVPTIPVECRGLIIHIRLEEGDNELFNEYPHQLISLSRLGSKAVQKLIASSTESSNSSLIELTHFSKSSTSGQALVLLESDDGNNATSVPDQKADQEKIKKVQVRRLQSDSSNVDQAKEDSLDRSTSPADVATAADARKERVEAEEISRSFLRACQSYRVQVDSCAPDRAVAGPSVWRFYVRLSRGQRLDPVRNVLEDIGREMARSGLLLSTIPNSEEVALDVPRTGTDRKKVPVQLGIDALPLVSSPEQMPILIGVTPEGEHVIRNLGQMPHLMVGGTTGSGKTIFLYSLLASLLHTHPDPRSLRLFLSTSKPEDFSIFQNLPHLEQNKVISDAKEAVESLQAGIIQLFDTREQLLMNAGCRDIGEYNQRESTFLPPYVIVVDEFADLADQLAYDKSGQREFYTQLRRVAQLGRNRGVHLVLCTQRPSADLVPTNIRNLMNNRVALRVNDSTASRMILDEPGAESLQMHGDLLFKEETNLTRAQGYFTSGETLAGLLRRVKASR